MIERLELEAAMGFPQDIEELRLYSEIIYNFTPLVLTVGGSFALLRWIASRRDRSAGVLFDLENRFNSAPITEAREVIEQEVRYRAIRMALIRAVLPVDEAYADEVPNADTCRILCSLDILLRFYVFLLGIRLAKQTPDASLRACYRYWLAHYHNPRRRELRLYIDSNYPTLKEWLARDQQVGYRRSFFRPGDFGWAVRAQPSEEQIRQASTERVLVLCGAGLSVASGLKTFLGKDGLYHGRKPELLATARAFMDDEAVVWEWYAERRGDVRAAEPNAAHLALAGLARYCQDLLVVSQNVDDLLERAGLPAESLVHAHGKLLTTRCHRCNYEIDQDEKSNAAGNCPKCHSGRLRPGVVWFDEDVPEHARQRVETFLAASPCSLVLVVGTSARFDYIPDWAFRGAGEDGLLVEVNPARTPITSVVDLAVSEKCEYALPRLLGA